jgi:hypothetical protein
MVSHGKRRGRGAQERESGGGAGAGRRIAALTALFALLAACSSPPPPAKPALRTTKAFDAVFGELPPIPLQAPAYASVVYFPAAKAPGRYLPAPIFTTEDGKEEFLTVRTAVRGVDQETFAKEVDLPFPKGTDLASYARRDGKAVVGLGGNLRAATMSKIEKERAAGSLFLTVEQSRIPVLPDCSGSSRSGRKRGGRRRRCRCCSIAPCLSSGSPFSRRAAVPLIRERRTRRGSV